MMSNVLHYRYGQSDAAPFGRPKKNGVCSDGWLPVLCSPLLVTHPPP